MFCTAEWLLIIFHSVFKTPPFYLFGHSVAVKLVSNSVRFGVFNLYIPICKHLTYVT